MGRGQQGSLPRIPTFNLVGPAILSKKLFWIEETKTKQKKKKELAAYALYSPEPLAILGIDWRMLLRKTADTEFGLPRSSGQQTGELFNKSPS